MLEATGKILERTDKIEEILDEMTEALGKIAANKTQMESLYEIKTY